MRINESLNLVIPIRSDEKGPSLYAYHTPISREVFEANYRSISATKAVLAGKGIRHLMGNGPRIASLTFKDEARKDAIERGDVTDDASMDIGEAFMQELKRLTTILAPGPNGWEVLPVDTAVARQVIDEEEWDEAESSIVFFTCLYALSRRAERQDVMRSTSLLLEGSSTSLLPTAFAASLQTLTKESPSVAKVASSVPS